MRVLVVEDEKRLAAGLRNGLEQWARQLLVDGAAGDDGAVSGDVAVLETIRARNGEDLGEGVAAALEALAGALANGQMDALAAAAEALIEALQTT